MDAIVYIQTGCSKSDTLLTTLNAASISYRCVDLTKTPPTVPTLIHLAAKANVPLLALTRNDNPQLKTFLKSHPTHSEEDLAVFLHSHPHLIQRPLIEHGGTVVVVRSPDQVASIINRLKALT